MADYYVPICGSLLMNSPKVGDRCLTRGGKGVKRLRLDATDDLRLNDYRLALTRYGEEIEFPIIGKSLPCVFTITYVAAETRGNIAVIEYGAIPDPDYFKIIDLDEDGLPIYADTDSDLSIIQLFKKPIVNGTSLGDRLILKTVDNTAENRLLYKIPEPVEIDEP